MAGSANRANSYRIGNVAAEYEITRAWFAGVVNCYIYFHIIVVGIQRSAIVIAATFQRYVNAIYRASCGWNTSAGVCAKATVICINEVIPLGAKRGKSAWTCPNRVRWSHLPEPMIFGEAPDWQ